MQNFCLKKLPIIIINDEDHHEHHDHKALNVAAVGADHIDRDADELISNGMCPFFVDVVVHYCDIVVVCFSKLLFL